ncbi:hypothetical protein [Sinorhizobium alkalisoli]|uniref:hypothetical protein n=1 Tax=Sinorhizobium alkalisoli TaxID=1752398 RepID=UPI00124E8480|nr:hypothetical protein [Sinorhizobium alkalisoli]MCA1493908.1 hypothetical protein [Ensifer sp. NBAIM29]QFI66287.1 hypothetical protein EKH55_1413 [Sinorhizobium alkalisoli]
MRRHLPFLAALATAASIGASAEAGPLSDAAARAENQANTGDTAAAWETLRQAVGDFSQTLPFAIGKAVFVTAAPAGYAMYEPKQDATFKTGEKLVSYVEPLGLTWKKSGDEKVETRFTVDLDILNPDGDVLASRKAFGDFTFTGYMRNQEIYATLTVDISSAPAGDYVLRYRFNDINSGETATVDQKFQIAAQ